MERTNFEWVTQVSKARPGPPTHRSRVAVKFSIETYSDFLLRDAAANTRSAVHFSLIANDPVTKASQNKTPPHSKSERCQVLIAKSAKRTLISTISSVTVWFWLPKQYSLQLCRLNTCFHADENHSYGSHLYNYKENCQTDRDGLSCFQAGE
jgi:hypothetical protein